MAAALVHTYIPTTRRNNIHPFSYSQSLPKRRKYPAPIFSMSTTLETSRLFEAAKHTVDNYIRSGMVVGLGSGRASDLVIQYLGQQLQEGRLKDIVGIPTSVLSANEAAKAGIPLDHYPNSLKIDFAFNDVNIIEEGTLAAVIGQRKLHIGESLIQEKSIVMAASKLVYIVTEKQYTQDLEGSIPVLVNTVNWMETAEEIDDQFLGDAEVWRRPSVGYAGPTGGDFPLVTSDGHNVLDVIFTSPILNLYEVAESLERIDGVLHHGVIFGIPCTAVIASEDELQIASNFSQNVIKERILDHKLLEVISKSC